MRFSTQLTIAGALSLLLILNVIRAFHFHNAQIHPTPIKIVWIAGDKNTAHFRNTNLKELFNSMYSVCSKPFDAGQLDLHVITSALFNRQHEAHARWLCADQLVTIRRIDRDSVRQQVLRVLGLGAQFKPLHHSGWYGAYKVVLPLVFDGPFWFIDTDVILQNPTSVLKEYDKPTNTISAKLIPGPRKFRIQSGVFLVNRVKRYVQQMRNAIRLNRKECARNPSLRNKTAYCAVNEQRLQFDGDQELYSTLINYNPSLFSPLPFYIQYYPYTDRREALQNNLSVNDYVFIHDNHPGLHFPGFVAAPEPPWFVV